MCLGWFHIYVLRRAARNAKQAIITKWEVLPTGFEQPFNLIESDISSPLGQVHVYCTWFGHLTVIEEWYIFAVDQKSIFIVNAIQRTTNILLIEFFGRIIPTKHWNVHFFLEILHTYNLFCSVSKNANLFTCNICDLFGYSQEYYKLCVPSVASDKYPNRILFTLHMLHSFINIVFFQIKENIKVRKNKAVTWNPLTLTKVEAFGFLVVILMVVVV